MDSTISTQVINLKTQEMLVRTHVNLVKRIAYQVLRQVPNIIQLDDLMQAGMLGLLEATRHYDESKGASFETYANIRIRGHMLDEVRRNDWVPRSVYRNARMIAEAVKKIENAEGREAKDIEVAEALDLSVEKFNDILKDTYSGQLLSLDDLTINTDTQAMGAKNEPHSHILREELSGNLSHMINSLPEKERLVICLYYKQDLSLKEIGEVLSVSESRVSQIHHQATLHLRSHCQELLSCLSDQTLDFEAY